jgi:hypothetical protein
VVVITDRSYAELAAKTIFPAGFSPHCAQLPIELVVKIVPLVEPHIY